MDVLIRRLALAVACALCGSAGAAHSPEHTLEELMEIPVVGASKYAQRQREVAAAVHVITRDEIEAFGWTTVAQALASLPGMQSTYDRQFIRLGARGFGPPGDLNTRLLVMVDGVRWNEPTFDSAPLGRELPIDLALVERIEFFPGPGSAVYGQNAMFGVINVITRSGAAFDGAEVAAKWQPRERGREGRATFGKLLDNGVDLTFSATGIRTQGRDLDMEFPRAGPGGRTLSGVVRGLDGEQHSEAFVRAAWEGWTLQGAYGNTHKDDPTGFYLSDPFATDADYRFTAWYANLTYAGMAGDLDVVGRIFLGRFHLTQHSVHGGFRSSTLGSSQWVGGELRAVTRRIGDHTLMAGLEFQDNARTDQSFDGPFGYSIRIPESSRRLGFYAQDEWRLASTLATTLGLRVDHSRTQHHRASPRIAAIWTPDEATTVKALYGRADREPNVFEAYYQDGIAQAANPGLGAEKVDTLELHVDRKSSPSVVMGGSVYAWRLQRPIVQGMDPASGLAQFQSGPTARGQGVEVNAAHTWAWGGRLRTSLALQSLDWTAQHEANSPRVLARALFSGPLLLPRLRFGYEVRYDGPRRTLAGERTGGFTVHDLTLTADFPEHGLRTGLTASNLFGKRYALPASSANWQDALPQDGASLRAWVRWSF